MSQAHSNARAGVADLSLAPGDQIDVAAWVHRTARALNIHFAPTRLDEFAAAVSRLCDAEVELDETEQLLLALERCGVITDRQGFALHATYLRQHR